MQDLRTLRTGWEAVEQIETQLLRNMTVQESLRQWAMLQAAFEPQLKATEALFAGERRQALAELQARLRRFAEWAGQHGTTLSLDSGVTTASE